MTGLAYHDGELLAAGTVRLDASDAGFLHGDGVFETLLVNDGRPVDLEAHLERLEAGLRVVEIEPEETMHAFAEAAREVASGAARPFSRLRITISRGVPGRRPTSLITAEAYRPPTPEQRRDGVDVVVLDGFPVAAGAPLCRVKSTSYQVHVLAHRQATRAGAFDGILLNSAGRVVEGSRSNVLARFGKEVVTPPESEGSLPGTVRRRLLEARTLTERAISVDALREADEILLTSSLVGVLPVGRLDGRPVPPGSAARELARYWETNWMNES